MTKRKCTHAQTRRLGKKRPYTWICLICGDTWEGKG